MRAIELIVIHRSGAVSCDFLDMPVPLENRRMSSQLNKTEVASFGLLESVHSYSIQNSTKFVEPW